MTGVGYAAPLLFDVFGLLSGGEWFAEPHGDLEAAVVCRQSGCLASHICPDRDTLMIPRAAAAGEVCPYHRIVNLSRDLRYRVTADCYDPGANRPDADVYPAACAGVVLQEAHPDINIPIIF